MQITVDADLCSGQGRCYVVSPSLFSSDEVGFCAERGQTLDVPDGAGTRRPAGRRLLPRGRHLDHPVNATITPGRPFTRYPQLKSASTRSVSRPSSGT